MFGPCCCYKFVAGVRFGCVLDKIAIDNEIAHMLNLLKLGVRRRFCRALLRHTIHYVGVSIFILEHVLLCEQEFWFLFVFR